MLLATLVTITCPVVAAHVTLTLDVTSGGNVAVQCGEAQPLPPDPLIPPPVKCPAVPYTKVTLGWDQTLRHYMSSGQVSAFPIPAPIGSKVGVALTQGQIAGTPNSLIEMTVSKCPGVITKAIPQCYGSSGHINFFRSPDAYMQPKFTWKDQVSLGNRGCWAPAAEGPWYVNVKWTFLSPCAGACGFSVEWSEGSY